MGALHRFSALGHENIIERRDALFDPYKETKTTYLSLKDLTEPRCEFTHKSSPEEQKEAFKKLEKILDDMLKEDNIKALVKHRK